MCISTSGKVCKVTTFLSHTQIFGAKNAINVYFLTKCVQNLFLLLVNIAYVREKLYLCGAFTDIFTRNIVQKLYQSFFN